MSEVIDILTVLLTALPIYLGFRFLERSELIRRVDELEGVVRQAEETATKYWAHRGNHGECRRLERKIKNFNRRLGMQTARLSRRYGRSFRFDQKKSEKLIAFKHTISGGKFETRDRDAEPNRELEIQTAADDLIDCLRDAINFAWWRGELRR